MSVAPNDPMYLIDTRRPRVLGGLGKDPVWRITTEDLGDNLVYRPDPDNPQRHGFIEPARVMTFDDYQAYLAASATFWKWVLP